MLRVDTERRFLPRFKNQGLAPPNVSTLSAPSGLSLDFARDGLRDGEPFGRLTALSLSKGLPKEAAHLTLPLHAVEVSIIVF
jgi:hypothetical protein